MDKLRFATFTWPNNPTNMTLKCTKNLKDFFVPNNGTNLQNYGQSARILSGEGEFFSTSAFVSYFKLFNLFKDNTPKELYIPGFVTYSAYFSEFTLLGEPGPESIKYSFTFVEDIFTEIEHSGPNSDTASTFNGTTIWAISNAYNIAVETLIELNPSITDAVLPPNKELILKK